MKQTILYISLILLIVACSDNELIKEGKVNIEGIQGQISKRLNFKVYRQDDVKIWYYSENKKDTLFTVTYQDTNIPDSIAINNDYAQLTDTFSIDNHLILKYYTFEEGVHDSEGSWYLSTDYGLLGTFGHGGPKYLILEKNGELVTKLKEHSMSF